MADKVYDVIQFGRQSAVGTAVAATTKFPGKADAPDLDRAYRNPEEDYGSTSDEQPGRGAYGIRAASTRLTSDVRYQDIMHLAEMHAAGGISPTAGTGVYTWTYTPDETSDSTKKYTIELGSDDATDQWRLTGCVADSLAIGFDALTAPGNAPWTADASILALDREIHALTGSLSAPATLETAEGHFTTLAEGTTSTAFSSLSALTGSLIMFRLTSTRPFVRRVYGGASDTATGWGVSGKAGATFEAELKVGSTAKTNVHDIFDAAGSVVTERRWRVRASGSGVNTLTLDARVRFKTVGRGEREGEPTYLVAGSCVYDSTLGGRYQLAVANAISVIP